MAPPGASARWPRGIHLGIPNRALTSHGTTVRADRATSCRHRVGTPERPDRAPGGYPRAPRSSAAQRGPTPTRVTVRTSSAASGPVSPTPSPEGAAPSPGGALARRTGEDDVQPLLGELLDLALAPLHDDHRIRQRDVQIQVLHLLQSAAQPVGVHMHQRRAVRQRRVHPGDDEGGRGHGARAPPGPRPGRASRWSSRRRVHPSGGGGHRRAAVRPAAGRAPAWRRPWAR